MHIKCFFGLYKELFYGSGAAVCEKSVLSGKTDWMRAVTHMNCCLWPLGICRQTVDFKVLRHINDALFFL